MRECCGGLAQGFPKLFEETVCPAVELGVVGIQAFQRYFLAGIPIEAARYFGGVGLGARGGKGCGEKQAGGEQEAEAAG